METRVDYGVIKRFFLSENGRDVWQSHDFYLFCFSLKLNHSVFKVKMYSAKKQLNMNNFRRSDLLFYY